MGIFNKIKSAFNLSDERHAAFELSKGRLTTNRLAHTGHGIFFASRMFDRFGLYSGGIDLYRPPKKDVWIFDSDEGESIDGTLVTMDIYYDATQTQDEIFSLFGTKKNRLVFAKTHISLNLMRYEGEELVSRSQARRLLARLEQFGEAMLDFHGVNTIGHSFVDEIFRVFQLEHPNFNLYAVNTTSEISEAIDAARMAHAIETQGKH